MNNTETTSFAPADPKTHAAIVERNAHAKTMFPAGILDFAVGCAHYAAGIAEVNQKPSLTAWHESVGDWLAEASYEACPDVEDLLDEITVVTR